MGSGSNLFAKHEEWLMHRVLDYARARGYTKYTSTLAEAWRMSIAGLSEALSQALLMEPDQLELSPDEDYTQDPLASFGILEAQRHRQRGVSLSMFLGLLVYYRQAYLDLLREMGLDRDAIPRYRLAVERFFDRLIVGFCSEWASQEGSTLIHELQETNRTLQNEKTEYLTFFESLANPVFLLDPDGRIRNLNFAAADLLGLPRRPGGYYYGAQERLALPGPLAEGLAVYEATGAEEHVAEMELAGRQFQARYARVLDVVGRLTGTTVALTDITELRRQEEERRRLEARMLESQRMESLSVLAGGVAHDFNNILTAIVGYTTLALRAQPAGSLAEKYLREVEKSALRATELARQMLAYSGKGHFVVQPLDLNQLVERMAVLLHATVSRKATLSLRLAAGIPLIEADETQMRQMLLNLVVNASEALGDGEGDIWIETGTARVTKEQASFDAGEIPLLGEYVTLTVGDTGVGMDQKTQERIFDPFFSTKFTGRGLGLAAVSGIVRGHKGAIRVQSKPDGGTTFTVFFPPAGAAGATAAQSSAAESTVLPEEVTVLVVDDEDAVREMARTMLEEAGIRVLAASDGREALRVLRSHAGKVDAVLLDLTMPHLDGADTLAAMRAMGVAVPVLLSSGCTEEEAAARAPREQVAAFVQKPYQPADLLRVLAETLSAVNRPRQTSDASPGLAEGSSS